MFLNVKSMFPCAYDVSLPSLSALPVFLLVIFVFNALVTDINAASPLKREELPDFFKSTYILKQPGYVQPVDQTTASTKKPQYAHGFNPTWNIYRLHHVSAHLSIYVDTTANNIKNMFPVYDTIDMISLWCQFRAYLYCITILLTLLFIPSHYILFSSQNFIASF